MLLALSSACALAAPESTSAEALLRAADSIRNPPNSFNVKIRLTEYTAGALSSSASIDVFSKPAVDSGQYDNLVRYNQPVQDAGKLVLRRGRDMWFYDPASHATVRISPQARLFGVASTGDVMTTNLSKDYAATVAGTETINDAAQVPRNSTRLHLTAERADVPYPQADYWIDAASEMPVKIVFRNGEGRALKTVYFRSFKMIGDRMRPTETVIIDELRPSWITVVTLADYKPFDLPDAWLQRDFLPRVPLN